MRRSATAGWSGGDPGGVGSPLRFAPFLGRSSAENAEVEPVTLGIGETFGLYRATRADPFGLPYLTSARPHLGDREEQFGVLVPAGSTLLPLRTHFAHFRAASFPLSAGELRARPAGTSKSRSGPFDESIQCLMLLVARDVLGTPHTNTAASIGDTPEFQRIMPPPKFPMTPCADSHRTTNEPSGLDSSPDAAHMGSLWSPAHETGQGAVMISIFLVDNHEVVRRGVADLLDADPELTVVGEASTVAQALARIPKCDPDLAILDVRLPDGNGIELCRELRSRLPELNCLMLTSFPDEEAMAQAVLAGAGGYVVKDVQGLQLLSAVREVGSGRSLMDSRAATALLRSLRSRTEQRDPTDALSERERHLLDLIGEGLTNRQIAQRMYLAEKTVKNYVSRLLTKLGLERRTQAAVLATRMRQQRRSG